MVIKVARLCFKFSVRDLPRAYDPVAPPVVEPGPERDPEPEPRLGRAPESAHQTQTFHFHQQASC